MQVMIEDAARKYVSKWSINGEIKDNAAAVTWITAKPLDLTQVGISSVDICMVDPVVTEIPNRHISRRHTITVALCCVQKAKRMPVVAVINPVAVMLTTEVNLRPKCFWTWV